MSFGNLTQRPDLQPLFGALSSDENRELLDRLLVIEGSLVQLAEAATGHVGIPYRSSGLSLVTRSDGSAAGIHGGPTGDAGDIWFDISLAVDPASGREVAPPWVVESRLVVFCSDSPEPGDDANAHDLLRLEATAHTPAAVLDTLETHVAILAAELRKHPPARFSETPHAELARLGQQGTPTPEGGASRG